MIRFLTITATADTVRLDYAESDDLPPASRTFLRSQTRPGHYWQMGGDWTHATEAELTALGVLDTEHAGPGTYGHTDIVPGPVLRLALRGMGLAPR